MLINENNKQIYKKIYEISKKIPKIKKDKTNTHFKSRYADINVILEVLDPILLEYNVMLLQPARTVDGVLKVNTILTDMDSMEQFYTDGLDINSNSLDPQKVGSAITYFRRYDLVSLFAMEQEDDDGNAGSNKTEDDRKEEKLSMNRVMKLGEVSKLIEETETDEKELLKYFKVSDKKFLSNEKIEEAIKLLTKKKEGK